MLPLLANTSPRNSSQRQKTPRNHNLEQQAQTMFDSFTQSDNGLGYCELKDIAVINPRRVLRKGDIARCIEMSSLSTSGSFPSNWEFKQYEGGMKFMNGDTIMARITPCLENGKVAYINFLNENEVAFGSTEYIIISAKDGFPPELFYFLTRNKDFVDYATKNMNGSSGRQRVSAETIEHYVLPVLTEEQKTQLSKMTIGAMAVICRNCIENISLRASRDAILPGLMSGELKINDLNC
ncbi:MAG: hypothetical protein ACI3ZN_04980 [Candidatus Cryptobacteroides sp.]